MNKPKPTETQANVPTSNRYDTLSHAEGDEDDPTMDTDEIQNNQKSTLKPPPPIVIHGQTKSHTELTRSIKNCTTSEFNIKYTRNNINIIINNREERTKYINQLITQKVDFHTYSDVSEKTHAFVVRGLTDDVTAADLAEELKTKHRLPVVNCYKMTLKNHQQLTTNKALFLLVTRNNVTLRGLTTEIKYALHTRIYFERRRNNRRITQCHSCQAWGHATSNCHANLKCMFCADNHQSKTCKNKEKLKCANCGEEHKSNDAKCSVYLQKIDWLNNNSQQRQQQQTERYRYREEEYPDMYKPAHPPEQNAWSQRPTQQPQGSQHHQHQKQTQQQQPRSQQQQQQEQQTTPQQQRQQQSRQPPPTYSGTPPITYTQHTESFQELATQLNILNTLVNINELIRAVKDIIHLIKTCTSKQDRLLTLIQFAQDLDQYDI